MDFGGEFGALQSGKAFQVCKTSLLKYSGLKKIKTAYLARVWLAKIKSSQTPFHKLMYLKKSLKQGPSVAWCIGNEFQPK